MELIGPRGKVRWTLVHLAVSQRRICELFVARTRAGGGSLAAFPSDSARMSLVSAGASCPRSCHRDEGAERAAERRLIPPSV